jgi:hypothetical protein
MFKQILTVVVGLALSGCASTPPPPKPGKFAWDGSGRDPNLRRAISRGARAPGSDQNIERERVLATLKPYSAAWWVVHDEIESESDRRTNAKLVICRGCLAHVPDATGSIP